MCFFFFFFFNDTATTEIYTLSLHDALPIYLRQPLQAVLGGDVGALEGRGAQPVHRADVHHAPPAVRVHVRQGAAHQPEGGLEHQPEDQREAVDGELVHRRDVLQPRVVDQHVDVEVECVEAGEVGEVDGERGA